MIISSTIYYSLGTPYQCKVCLPQHDNANLNLKHCALQRQKETVMQQQYYKLTIPKDPSQNPDNEPLFPRLDQPHMTIAMKASFGKEDAEWFSNYYGNIQLLNVTMARLKPLFGNRLLNSYAEYLTIYEAFLKTNQV